MDKTWQRWANYSDSLSNFHFRSLLKKKNPVQNITPLTMGPTPYTFPRTLSLLSCNSHCFFRDESHKTHTLSSLLRRNSRTFSNLTPKSISQSTPITKQMHVEIHCSRIIIFSYKHDWFVTNEFWGFADTNKHSSAVSTGYH